MSKPKITCALASFALLASCAGYTPPNSAGSRPVGAAQDRKAVDPSVVLASVYTLKTFNTEGEEIGLGSGFLSGGKIITNAHVVSGAAWVNIYDINDEHVSTAAFANWVSRENDLAVLPFHGNTGRGLVLQYGRPKLGEDIWAMGSPMGYRNTVSKGNVSALRDGDDGDPSVVQITAPISQGSSGGPIVTSTGEVIGVVVAYQSGGQNINFAVATSRLPRDVSVLNAQAIFPGPVLKPAYDDSDAPSMTEFQALGVLSNVAAKDVAYGNNASGYFSSAGDVGDATYAFFSFEGVENRLAKVTAEHYSADLSLTIYNEVWREDIALKWSEQDLDSGLGSSPYLESRLPTSGKYFVLVKAPLGTRGRVDLFTGEKLPGYLAPASDEWTFVATSAGGSEYFLSSDLGEVKNGYAGGVVMSYDPASFAIDDGSGESTNVLMSSMIFSCNGIEYAMTKALAYSRERKGWVAWAPESMPMVDTMEAGSPAEVLRAKLCE